jgi:exopolysaccharide transport family protein
MTTPIAWTDDPALPNDPKPLEVRALLHILWRRKWVMLVCIALMAGLGFIYLKQARPVFKATAEVMLTGRNEQVVDLRQVVEDFSRGDRELAPNELRIISSQRLVEQVIDRLRLDRDPELNEAIAPSGMRRFWQVDVVEALRELKLTEGAPATLPDAHSKVERERLAIIDAFRERLEVTGVPHTRSIAISFSSTDAVKAALIANTLAELYIVDQLETKFEATRRASAWLSARLGELKQKVQLSETAVEDFKARQAAGAGQGMDLTAQQIAELNAELIAARAARAEAEARFRQVQGRVNSGGLAAASNVVDSALILTLRTNLSELARREAELSQTYGEKHPNIINIRAEIQDARNAISAEVRKIIEALRNDVAVAVAREETLRASLIELEDRSVVLAQGSVELRQLEREAEADRLIYETFLNRFRETSEQEDLQTADARLLSEATPPLKPSSPDRRRVLALAGAVGVLLGSAIVVLLEILSNTFRAVSEVSEHTGLPVLASLPRQRRKKRRDQLLSYVQAKPNATLTEAVRTLRTALFLSDIDNPPKVVMVTSSVPGEGKSTTALLLAHLSTQMNKSAIVVDCDIRRPALHDALNLEGSIGIMSILDGSTPLDAAISVDDASGVHVLPTVAPIPQAADVLSSARFRKLIESLRNRYDLVILDTPPILLVSDAGAVGKLADTVIYAVRWDHTPREAAVQGINALRELGIKIAGAVVTLVDRKREAKYAYANYGSSYAYYAEKNSYFAN